MAGDTFGPLAVAVTVTAERAALAALAANSVPCGTASGRQHSVRSLLHRAFEVEADPRAGRSGLLRHAVQPVALAAPTHDDQVPTPTVKPEPGTVSFRVYRDPANVDYLLFVEHFADQAAYDAHTGSAVYQELIAGRFAGIIVEFVEIDHELVASVPA